jgi:antitoxin component YwqK of YwqJK toxin-antitoxin module
VNNKVDLPDGSGKFTLLYVNGRKRVDGAYLNNNRSGEWKEYFFDGSVKSVKYYKNGLIDSVYRDYYYGGNLSTEGKYVMGKKSGDWKNYSPEGKIYSLDHLEDDELENKKYTYYDNGKVETETEYDRGEIHGIHKHFDESGALRVQLTYEHGTPVSYSYQDKSGNLVPLVDLNHGNGKITGYYSNGKKSIEYEFSDDRLDNNYKTFFPDGTPHIESHQQFGYSEGETKIFYSNGKLKSSTVYLDNEEDGPFKRYYPNGNVRREGEYFLGFSHGTEKLYNDKGTLTETRLYYFDQLLDVRK